MTTILSSFTNAETDITRFNDYRGPQCSCKAETGIQVTWSLVLSLHGQLPSQWQRVAEILRQTHSLEIWNSLTHESGSGVLHRLAKTFLELHLNLRICRPNLPSFPTPALGSTLHHDWRLPRPPHRCFLQQAPCTSNLILDSNSSWRTWTNKSSVS